MLAPVEEAVFIQVARTEFSQVSKPKVLPVVHQAIRVRVGRHEWVEIEPVDASSTEVRKRLAEGGDPAELLEPQVFTFIRQKGLYGIEKGP